MTNLRPELQAFAEAMEAKLQENEHKGNWKTLPLSWLLMRLKQEVLELDYCVELYRRRALNSYDEIAEEACDVANFAMMIYDNIRTIQ